MNMNWTFGWLMILLAFVTGATIGLWFHREEFMGGYNSFRRRITRLGHIAFAALGMMNVLYGLAPSEWRSDSAAVLLVIGGFTMPMVCFLTAWREPMRHLFFIPVLTLCSAVVTILIKASS